MPSATKETQQQSGWLAELRKRAQAELQTTPLPPPHSEVWRRTKFSSWDLDQLVSALKSKPSVNGKEGAAPLPKEGENGIVVTSLEEGARRFPEKVRPYLEETWAGPDFQRLELANLACWQGGNFLYVPRGVKAAVPAEFLLQSQSFPRSLIVLEPESELYVVESHISGGRLASSEVSAAFSRLVLGEGARAYFFYIQELAPHAVHFWHQRCTLAKDAQLFHTTVALGGKIHKSNLQVELCGPGARSELFGIFLGDSSRHFDAFTHQLHKAAHTYSDLLFKSVLKEDSRLVYNGLIRIEKEAVETNAYQANHNLLLSPQARADSTPILEILTDSVHCKHGATVGPLDPEELFYIQTRGLTDAEAEKMLILGFFEPILKRLPLGTARERLMARMGLEMEEA